MKTINKKTMAVTWLLVALSVSLFSFSPGKGGEGFEIYLNNKLVLQQFGNQLNKVQTISLDQSVNTGQLNIKYYHCGQMGKNRSITIRNHENKILKEWRYPDVSAGSIAVKDITMSCKVADILSVQKKNPGKLNLYYSSSELPKGRLLVTIQTESGNLARK
jgi:hypothetical protein